MEKNIKIHLDGLFVKAHDGEVKTEVLDELYLNLCDKYNDLVAGGVSPEQAYEETVEGIGDVDEIVNFINAGTSRSKGTDFDFSEVFEGFESRIRSIAKELEGPLKDVGNDIKNAANMAWDTAKSAKEPIKNAVDSAKSGIKDVVSSVEMSDRGKNIYRYDYEVSSTNIENIDIHSGSGKVFFGTSQDDNIYVVEYSSQPLEGDKRASIECTPDSLIVYQGKKTSAAFLFGIGMVSSNFEIYLPKKHYTRIYVKASSGKVDMDYELEASRIEIVTTSGEVFGNALRCQEIDVHTASGDITLNSLMCDKAKFVSTSGDVELDGTVAGADISSTSGDIDVNGNFNVIEMHSTSGDVEFDGFTDNVFSKTISGDMSMRISNVPNSLQGDSVSGDIKVYVPDNDGFTLNYKRVSGEIKSDFNLMTSINSRDGNGVYRDGSLRTYRLKTVSGDIKILKR